MMTEFRITHKDTIHKIAVYPSAITQESEMYEAGAYVVIDVEEVGEHRTTLLLKKSQARALASVIMGAAADLHDLHEQQ